MFQVPLEGFSALQGISGSQKFQIHKAYGSPDHLPSAHTWYIVLPFEIHSIYNTYLISVWIIYSRHAMLSLDHHHHCHHNHLFDLKLIKHEIFSVQFQSIGFAGVSI